MRPRTLTVEGFTSFRKRQEISFVDNLFVVAGPIGAGKTSLLDAISFALYGKPTKTGLDPRHLISKGAPALKVSLDFSVRGEVFNVTRTAHIKVPTAAQLTRLADDKPLAGTATDATRAVTALLGYGHDVFVRCVVLPQGKFDRFLVGTGRDKQAVLEDLLGFSLYERMKELAGQRRSLFEGQAQGWEIELGRLTATADTLREKGDELKVASERAVEGARLQEALTPLVGSWTGLNSRISKLSERIEVLEKLKQRLDGEVEKLQASWAEVEGARLEYERASEADAGARAALDKAAKELDALKASGDAATITHNLGLVSQLSAAEADLATTVAELAKQEKVRATQGAALKVAQTEVDDAEKQHQEVLRLYQAAAISRDLAVGDPCPVCGEPLAKLPEAHGRHEVDEAKALSDAVRTKLTAAQQEAARLDGALQTRRKQLNTLQQATDGRRAELDGLFPGRKPDELSAELKGRLESLKLAEQSVAARNREREAALKIMDEVNRKRTDSQLGVDTIRQELAGIVALAAQSADSETPARSVPAVDGVVEWCNQWTQWLSAEIDEVRQSARILQLDADEGAGRCNALLHGWLTPETPVEQLLSNLQALVFAAKGNAQVIADELARAEAELEKRAELSRGIGEARGDGAAYEELRLAMLPGAFPRFLFNHTIERLSGRASELFFEVTERFRLRTKDEKFVVIDTWAGDEESPVESLSGGETFLASLSVALALSEQVMSYSALEGARLESLFIDEGFGSLDIESLDSVIAALERLEATSERMVGLVSHVPALRERLAHVDVVKSQEGSYVGVQPAFALETETPEKPVARRRRRPEVKEAAAVVEEGEPPRLFE